jgi:hypothetical protein
VPVIARATRTASNVSRPRGWSRRAPESRTSGGRGPTSRPAARPRRWRRSRLWGPGKRSWRR